MRNLPIFLLSLLVIASIVTNSCLQVERHALLEFKASMIDSGNRLVSWRGLDCCRWAGIRCRNHTGRVIKLFLNPNNDRSNSLSGEINSSLLALIELRYLDLSHNNFMGETFPKFICSFRNLEYLDLSETNLSGIIPPQISNMSKLRTLYLGDFYYSNSLSINNLWCLSHLTSLKNLYMAGINIRDSIEWVQALNMLSSLESLSLYGNNLTTIPTSLLTINFSSLTDFSLSGNNFNTPIPSWIGEITSLTKLELEDCSFIGQIPNTFGNLTNLYDLSLSENSFVGEISEINITNLSQLEYMDISYNSFSGSLPPKLNTPLLSYLLLSNNHISGTMGQCTCGLINLIILDLSGNNIHGNLPNCWPNTLRVVNLGNNKITGTIPSFMPSLDELWALQLNNNSLNGEFPSSLQFCRGLNILDLGENKFYGKIPDWIWEISNLAILRLHANFFTGNIPSQLSYLTRLHVLDLGDNNLSGLIPDYLGKMMPMTLPNRDLKINSSNDDERFVSISIFMKDSMLVYSRNISLIITSIDLSGNNLTGEIPQSITSLSGLRNLNLSYNYLNGTIPFEIGKMQSLESLDLRSNELSGIIPPSLGSVTFLAILNLSYNNLSGKIPTGNQLQTFLDPYIYMGNYYLCGSPLNNSCNTVPILHGNFVQNENDKLDEIFLYLFTIIGLGFGFWLFFGVLMVKKTWRFHFFELVNSIYDIIYVFVMINLTRFRESMTK